MSGIVVASENEETILEAFWEAEHAAAQKDAEKRHSAVIKRWTRLVQGLRLRKRLQEQYGTMDKGTDEPVPSGDDPVEEPGPGGFLTQADDVVQAYVLPKNLYSTSERALDTDDVSAVSRFRDGAAPGSPNAVHTTLYMEEDGGEIGQVEESVAKSPPRTNGIIKSLVELAAEDAEGSLHNLSEPPVSAPESQDGTSDLASKLSVRPRRIIRSVGPTLTNAKPDNAKTKSRRSVARKRARSGASESMSPSSGEDAESKFRKPRTPKRTKAVTPSVPKSDRVLRTRRTKSEAVLRE